MAAHAPQNSNPEPERWLTFGSYSLGVFRVEGGDGLNIPFQRVDPVVFDEGNIPLLVGYLTPVRSGEVCYYDT
jgi:hypothetical protein